MRYTPRRRRGDEERSEGGGLPVVPLVIIVIFAGLLLGGLLAHFFGNRSSDEQQAMNPAPSAPVPQPTLVPSPTPFVRPRHTPAPHRSALPSPTPSALVTRGLLTFKPLILKQPEASAAPVVTAQPASPPAKPATQATATPSMAPLPAVVTASPRPILTATPHPAARTAVAPRSRGMQTDDPDEIVRAYLYALARGNTSQAESYLASGSPDEPFMHDAHVGDIASTNNGDGTYLVTADVRAASGDYRVTFTVAGLPQGMVITDHFYVKPRAH